ncbi:MAG: PadR family transcriptional regulator [Dehalococcoidia bacterium]
MALDREWMRGAAPLAVLTLLARRPMYGYELIEALELGSGGILELGQSTVYPLLYNLEARGLLRSVERTAPTGRRRKYYEPTATGLSWLESQQNQFDALVKALRRIGRASGGPKPVEET